MAAVGIVEWLRDQTFLVTGGTGFLGQALIFKLLKNGCRGVYLLVRSRRDKSPEERLDKIIGSYIFDSLREKDPNLRKKIKVIAVETGPSGFILHEEDRRLIENDVTIVHHAAASVKFDDPLTYAVFTNLIFTNDMIELAKNIKNLKLFHYVSTAYANFDDGQKVVEEKVYKPKMDWRKLVTVAKEVPQSVLSCLEPKILGESSNTYVFTKHLSEAAVNDAAQTIPTLITRPPVVINSIKEPVPGWMNNISSPIGIIGGSGKGILRVYYGPNDAPKSYVSADSYTNTALVASWHHCGERNDTPPVYHIDSVPMSPDDLYDFCMPIATNNPVRNALWQPRFHCVDNPHLYLIAHILLHFVPALLVDAALRLSGRRVMLCRIYRKMYSALSLLHPFLTCNDNFIVENWKKPEGLLSEEERAEFYCSLKVFRDDRAVLTDYINTSDRGFRRFLGEPELATKKDFRHMRMLYWLDKVFVASISGLALWYFPYSLVAKAGLSVLSILVPLEYSF